MNSCCGFLLSNLLMLAITYSAAALPVYSDTQELDQNNINYNREVKRSTESLSSNTQLEILNLRKEILQDILKETELRISTLEETIDTETVKPIEIETRYIGQSPKSPRPIETRYIGQSPKAPRPSRGRSNSWRKKFSFLNNRELIDGDVADINKLNDILKQLEAKEQELESQLTTTTAPETTTEEITPNNKSDDLYKKLEDIDNDLNELLNKASNTDSVGELTKRRGDGYRVGQYPKRGEDTSTEIIQTGGDNLEEQKRLIVSLLGDKKSD